MQNGISQIFSTIWQGFSPLKLPNFRTYMIGQAISLIGTWLQMTAQNWVVWELSHSEAALGIVTMLGTLPLLLLGPWAGVIADRFNRRGLLIFTQVGMMLLAFVLAGLLYFKLAELWHLYVLSVLLGIFSALDFPTQQAFLGDLAGMGEVRKAVNMNAMFLQAGRMIGPGLAGWIIGQWGAATAFGLNGLSFLAVIFSLIIVRATQHRRPPSGNSVFQDLWEGMRFVRSQPRIQDLLILTISVSLLAFSMMTVMPSFADERLGGDATTLGWLLASSGAGALVSVVFVMPIAQTRQRVGLMMSLGLIWAGGWFLVLSMVTWLPLAMFCLFALSFALPLVIAMSLGLLQVLAPPDMRGRLLSLFTMVSFGMQPLASLLVGNLSEQLGVAPVSAINGGLLVLIGLGMIFLRSGLRDWRIHAVGSGSPPPPAGH